MPIVRMKTAANPYSPLAWKTSLAILALEKLLKEKDLRPDELEALKGVSDQLDLFHKASEIDVAGVSRQPRLRSSFFALRAIQGENRTAPIKPLQFQEAGEEIHAIYLHLKESKTAGGLDKESVISAQNICIKLLEHLNKQRPNPSFR